MTTTTQTLRDLIDQRNQAIDAGNAGLAIEIDQVVTKMIDEQFEEKR